MISVIRPSRSLISVTKMQSSMFPSFWRRKHPCPVIASYEAIQEKIRNPYNKLDRHASLAMTEQPLSVVPSRVLGTKSTQVYFYCVFFIIMKRLILLLLSVILFTSCTQTENNNLISLESENTEIISNIVTCKLVISTNVSLKNDKLVAESNIDKNPLELIFSWLDKDKVMMRWNSGEVELEKIDVSGNQIYLFEETWAWNIVIYTLFRDTWILIMSKQYNLVWAFGLQMIWNCK